MTNWLIEQVTWDHPGAKRLREQQRSEHDARYGNDDHEPGIHPSAADVFAFFVARDASGEDTACGGLRMVDENSLGPGVVEIKRMYADPKARGKGAAAAILKALESHAAAHGAKKLVLETGTIQPDASRFYEKHGYTPIPLFDDYIGSQVSLCYARSLR